MKLKIYKSLQEAISDEPETVAQIFYNSCYLQDAIDFGDKIEDHDINAVLAKLDINEDRIRDIRFERDRYDRKFRKGRLHSELLGKRVIAWFIIFAVIVLTRRVAIVREAFSETLKTAGFILAFVIGMVGILLLLQFLFTKKPPQQNIEQDEDLFTMSPEEYKAKH